MSISQELEKIKELVSRLIELVQSGLVLIQIAVNL